MFCAGPLVPHYKDILVGSCLSAARDSDMLIRASAVSNLGQVCQHLHFSLGTFMFEVTLSHLFLIVEASLINHPTSALIYL